MANLGLPALSDGIENPTLAPLMASLSLILIAFFVLFYSMSMIDENKKVVAVGSLHGNFGYLDGGREVVNLKVSKAQLLNTPQIKERAAELQAKLDSYMLRRGLESSNIKVFVKGQGLDISLAHRLLYMSGSASLSPEGEALMLKLAGLLKGLRQVRFELFDFMKPSRKSSPTTLDGLSLAAVRAARLYRFLVLRGGWSAGVVRAFGRLAQPASAAGEHLLLRVVGGIPACVLDGKGGKIRVGDYTF